MQNHKAVVYISSGHGLSPVRNQAITWTNELLRTNFNETLSKCTTFFPHNEFENVVYKMAAIQFRPQCVMHIIGRTMYRTVKLDVSTLKCISVKSMQNIWVINSFISF